MKNRPIKYLITTYWETTDGWSGLEVTLDTSVDEWYKNSQEFIKKNPTFKNVLLNVFPIPEEIYEVLNSNEDGIDGSIAYSY